MSYRHGVYTEEQPTSITPPIIISGNAGLTVAIGTAPSHVASQAVKANQPVIAYNYAEAVRQLGYSEDFDNYTLCEAMSAFFVLYNISPIVFINVFDPDKHYEEKEFEAAGISETAANIGSEAILGTLNVTSGVDTPPDELTVGTDYRIDTDSDSTITLTILDVSNVTDDTIKYSYKTSRYADGITATRAVQVGTEIELDSDTLINTVKVYSGGTTKRILMEDVDYIAERSTDSAVIVTLLTDSNVVDDTVTIKYHEAAPYKVDAWDIIGGIDNETGETKGLELIESVYPRLGILPGIIISPKYSTNSAVAAVMRAKASLIDSTFHAVAIADIDTNVATGYQQAVNVKIEKNLVDPYLFLCYPKISLDGVQYHLSTHMAALMNQVDAGNNNIPYVSPSNHRLQCDSAVTAGGKEIYLTQTQASMLNGNGIVTALNYNGWILFGNRTSAYPNSADVKDNFIPIRRMFNYISNSLVVSFFSRIDNPLNRRLIESIETSANIWLDSLTAAGAILGGRCEFMTDDNALTKLIDGILTFRVYIAAPPPAKELVFILEYDANYLQTLFGE